MSRFRSLMETIVLALLIAGAVNWGLVGVFQFNLVTALLDAERNSPPGWLSRSVYALIGLAGVAALITTSALVPQRRSA